MRPWPESASVNYRLAAFGLALAMFPVASFTLQYLFSLRAGTVPLMLSHYSVTFVDWVFVPFNFFAVWVIDWRRGGAIFATLTLSLLMNALGHAFWQYNGVDAGHMISKDQIILPSGWVHLVFSALEMTLILSFVFARQSNAPYVGVTTCLALVYLAGAAISGLIMNGGFTLTDSVAFSAGFFLVVIYPLFTRQPRVALKEGVA